MEGDPAPPPGDDAGFTLLEVLAAVAIAGFALSAIGAVVAVTFAGLRSTADRVALAEAGRTLLDTLPEGDALRPGTTTGTMGAMQWRIDVGLTGRPVTQLAVAAPGLPAWRPAAVVIVARTRTGRSLRLETAGLVRDDAARGTP